MRGGRGTIFAPGNLIFQSKNCFLADFAAVPRRGTAKSEGELAPLVSLPHEKIFFVR